MSRLTVGDAENLRAENEQLRARADEAEAWRQKWLRERDSKFSIETEYAIAISALFPFARKRPRHPFRGRVANYHDRCPCRWCVSARVTGEKRSKKDDRGWRLRRKEADRG